jgi:hypothetical protein
VWYAVAISLVLVATRFAWVFVVTYVPRRVSRAIARRYPAPDWKSLTVVGWAGMRGIVSLAAAMALPMNFPHRDLILFITFGVILATLVVQGLTLPPLIRALRLPEEADGDDEEITARYLGALAAVERLDQLAARAAAVEGGAANAPAIAGCARSTTSASRTTAAASPPAADLAVDGARTAAPPSTATASPVPPTWRRGRSTSTPGSRRSRRTADGHPAARPRGDRGRGPPPGPGGARPRGVAARRMRAIVDVEAHGAHLARSYDARPPHVQPLAPPRPPPPASPDAASGTPRAPPPMPPTGMPTGMPTPPPPNAMPRRSRRSPRRGRARLVTLALGDSYTIGEGVGVADRWPVRLVAALRRGRRQRR